MSASSNDSGANNVQRHGDACIGIRDIESQLSSMSSAAYSLGLEGLSQQLKSLSIELSMARTTIHEAFREELNSHFKTTVQASANMLGAVMAMADKTRAEK